MAAGLSPLLSVPRVGPAPAPPGGDAGAGATVGDVQSETEAAPLLARAAEGRGRVLVAARRGVASEVVVRLAAALAGREGRVTVAEVVVVPMSESLSPGAVPDGEPLGAAARAAAAAGAPVATRSVRARAFAQGLLEAIDAESPDLVVIEYRRGQMRHGAEGQFSQLWERSPVPVVAVRSG